MAVRRAASGYHWSQQISTPIFPYLVCQALKAEIAGREIKFLVEQRVVGNVHLPIDAEQRTVRVNDGGGVVINAGGALFEQRGNDDDLVFFGEFLESVGARPGNFFRELEILVVLALAKILRAEQFLRADDLRAVFRRRVQ